MLMSSSCAYWPWFVLNSLITLAFTFSSSVSFGFNFWAWYEAVFLLHSFVCGYLVVSTPFTICCKDYSSLIKLSWHMRHRITACFTYLRLFFSALNIFIIASLKFLFPKYDIWTLSKEVSVIWFLGLFSPNETLSTFLLCLAFFLSKATHLKQHIITTLNTDYSLTLSACCCLPIHLFSNMIRLIWWSLFLS